MGQMSPVSERICSLCNLMRDAGDSHGSRETWITGFPNKLAALPQWIPQWWWSEPSRFVSNLAAWGTADE